MKLAKIALILSAVSMMGAALAQAGGPQNIAQLQKQQDQVRKMIVPGYYRGYFPYYDKRYDRMHKFETSIYIGATTQADSTASYFGVILAKNDIDDHFGAVYQIVPRENGLQAWVQQFRDDRTVTSEPEQRATFDVRTVYENGGSLKRPKLQFTVTDFGKTLGCDTSLESVRLNRRLRRWDLIGFPGSPFQSEEFRGTSVNYNTDIDGSPLMTGTVSFLPVKNEDDSLVEASNISGDFRIEPIFDSRAVGKLIKGATDPGKGIAYDEQLAGLIVSLERHRPILRDKYHFAVIDLPSVQMIGKSRNLCVSRTTFVEED